jgi:phosphatidylinositol-4,5-bisphosphate 3-kinase
MIQKIQGKNIFDKLSSKEKHFLWKYCINLYSLIEYKIPFFESCNYKDPNFNSKLKKMLKNANNIKIHEAIELLSGDFANELIREHAVNIIKQSTFTEISHYLLQLVQALKYEKNIDSPLAEFLLSHAITHPITIGHEFFWHLRAEMYNPDVQKKFGLYLEVFLQKLSKPLYKIFEDENELLNDLIRIANNSKVKTKGKDDVNKNFKSSLEELDKKLKENNKEVSLPLNFKFRIKGIDVENCKIMKSKKKPIWLTFKNADTLGDAIAVMLKCGDDLRMDMVTLQLFRAMQTLWFNGGLKVKMSLYKVLCTGYQQGMLEMVRHSETLANIHVKHTLLVS